jgi:hypothetical protein
MTWDVLAHWCLCAIVIVGCMALIEKVRNK